MWVGSDVGIPLSGTARTGSVGCSQPASRIPSTSTAVTCVFELTTSSCEGTCVLTPADERGRRALKNGVLGGGVRVGGQLAKGTYPPTGVSPAAGGRSPSKLSRHDLAPTID